jgi:hypothetical protein
VRARMPGRKTAREIDAAASDVGRRAYHVTGDDQDRPLSAFAHVLGLPEVSHDRKRRGILAQLRQAWLALASSAVRWTVAAPSAARLAGANCNLECILQPPNCSLYTS